MKQIEIKTKGFNLEMTLECGQCFRWKKNMLHEYSGIIKDRVILIKQTGNIISVKSNNMENIEQVVKEYFDLNEDYINLEKSITENDQILANTINLSRGLHFVNQDLFETIISYIISANNNIKRISSSIDAISKLCGKKIEFNENVYYLFPTVEELAKLSIEDLKNTKVGFRANYIYKTTRDILNEPDILEKLKNMDTESARKKLMTYTGIGRKVADCILLFSLKKRETFPVDVWIKRVMEKLYLNKDTSINDIIKYASNKFGKNAGLAQEHLYIYARENKI